MLKTLYGLIVLYFLFISFTGRAFFDSTSERKMTPKGSRIYYYHK